MRGLWSTVVIAIVLVGVARGEDVCRLQVHAVDLFGGILHPGHFRLDSGEKKYETGSTWEVPCGEHTISVEVRGFHQSVSTVWIAGGFQLKTFGLRVGELHIGPESRLTTYAIDDFEAYPGCDKLRVMSLLDAKYTYDSLVSSAGRVGLQNVPVGHYLVVLLGDKGICGTSVVRVPWNGNVKVRLRRVE